MTPAERQRRRRARIGKATLNRIRRRKAKVKRATTRKAAVAAKAAARLEQAASERATLQATIAARRPMPNEVATSHSNKEKPPTYDEVSDLLLDKLGLKMPGANVKLFLGPLMASARSNEEKRPNRRDLIKRITKLCDAACEIGEALASVPILSWLGEARPDLYEKWPDHWAATQDLAQTVEAALLLVPKGKGRARSTTRREISPRATCALFVVEMFKLSGRKPPLPTNARAHAIAEALWLASGGLPWTGHAKNLASWRRYFVETKEASPAYRQVVHEFIRMRLSTELQAKQA